MIKINVICVSARVPLVRLHMRRTWQGTTCLSVRRASGQADKTPQVGPGGSSAEWGVGP